MHNVQREADRPQEEAQQRLNKNIYSAQGTLLLPAGTALTRERLDALREHGIRLEEDDLDLIRLHRETVEAAVSEVKRIFDVVRHGERIPIQEVREQVLPHIRKLCTSQHLFAVLKELQSMDDYTSRHNIAVGVLSALIGKWLHLDKDELELLTLAASLHDIGKARVPIEILTKNGGLTSDEYSEIKQHTIYGYDLLKQVAPDNERLALVALQHHEREDGGGYPYGAAGSRLDPLSKVVAIADVFHAMTSMRVYRGALPFYRVLAQMRDDAFGRLEPTITTTFTLRIMESLIGNRVRLSDNRLAEIVYIHPHDPIHPIVKLPHSMIDLSHIAGLNIEEVL